MLPPIMIPRRVSRRFTIGAMTQEERRKRPMGHIIHPYHGDEWDSDKASREQSQEDYLAWIRERIAALHDAIEGRAGPFLRGAPTPVSR